MPSAASLHGDISYGYITAPSEVCNQLKQLNGVLVHGRGIIIEESQTKLKNKVDSGNLFNDKGKINYQNVDTSTFSPNLDIVPGSKSFSEAVGSQQHASSKNNNIVVFTDSIANFNRNMRQNFNKSLNHAKARFKYFPGGTAYEMQYYVIPTLEEKPYDAVVLHVGVNDLLGDEKEKNEKVKEKELRCKIQN